MLQRLLPLLASVGALRVPASPSSRVVAIGDVHGDYAALTRTLQIAGLIDDDESWTGGNAILVQLGDVLDRGSEEAQCWSLLRRLRQEAPVAGGRLVWLLGNHEVMNVCGHATPFVHATAHKAFGPNRLAAFAPGGALAADLAECYVAAIVGETCFVHAHLPGDATLESLEFMNTEMRRWLLGEVCPEDGCRPNDIPLALSHVYRGEDSPVWGRALSSPSNAQVPASQCDTLRRTLDRIGVARVVVGHTPQDFINAGCDGLVWRCDTGMSRYVAGGACEALEISPEGSVRILRAGGDGTVSDPRVRAAPRIAAAAQAAAEGQEDFYDFF